MVRKEILYMKEKKFSKVLEHPWFAMSLKNFFILYHNDPAALQDHNDPAVH